MSKNRNLSPAVLTDDRWLLDSMIEEGLPLSGAVSIISRLAAQAGASFLDVHTSIHIEGRPHARMGWGGNQGWRHILPPPAKSRWREWWRSQFSDPESVPVEYYWGWFLNYRCEKIEVAKKE